MVRLRNLVAVGQSLAIDFEAPDVMLSTKGKEAYCGARKHDCLHTLEIWKKRRVDENAGFLWKPKLHVVNVVIFIVRVIHYHDRSLDRNKIVLSRNVIRP